MIEEEKLVSPSRDGTMKFESSGKSTAVSLVPAPKLLQICEEQSKAGVRVN